MSIPQAAKAPQTDPTACPVCGSPVLFILRKREHPSGATFHFECGSSDIIRNGMHWPQLEECAAPPCLYIKGLREHLAALLGATEVKA